MYLQTYGKNTFATRYTKDLSKILSLCCILRSMWTARGAAQVQISEDRGGKDPGHRLERLLIASQINQLYGEEPRKLTNQLLSCCKSTMVCRVNFHEKVT